MLTEQERTSTDTGYASIKANFVNGMLVAGSIELFFKAPKDNVLTEDDTAAIEKDLRSGLDNMSKARPNYSGKLGFFTEFTL